jgi:hypothetical protein
MLYCIILKIEEITSYPKITGYRVKKKEYPKITGSRVKKEK